jgi:hypothetical protein
MPQTFRGYKEFLMMHLFLSDLIISSGVLPCSKILRCRTFRGTVKVEQTGLSNVILLNWPQDLVLGVRLTDRRRMHRYSPQPHKK